MRRIFAATLLLSTACRGGDTVAPASTVAASGSEPIAAAGLASGSVELPAVVGAPFAFDATALSFTSLRTVRTPLAITLAPSGNGLTVSGSRISGTPLNAGTTVATVTATDGFGHSATRVVSIIVLAAPARLTVASANTAQGATVGTLFSYDATRGGATFSGGLPVITYSVAFTPSANGLVATNGRITGTPVTAAATTVTITARDVTGQTASNSFDIVTFANDLVAPVLTPTFN